jgi:hypothetical protein
MHTVSTPGSTKENAMHAKLRSSPAPSTSSTAPAAPAPAAEVIRPTDFKVQYERFIPLAATVLDGDLRSFRGNPVIVLRNVTAGVDAIKGRTDEIRAALPTIPVEELLVMPEVGKALVYAVTLVADPVSVREIRGLIRVVRDKRNDLLNQADLLVGKGLLPADRVAAIHAGRGPVKTALDAVALAGLYADYQVAIAGKHPFSAEEIEKLGQDGEWLSQALKPRGAHPDAQPMTVTPRLVRDQLYSLLVKRHVVLRRVGSFFWGDDVDAHVPRLSSRALGGRPRGTKTTATVIPVADPPASGTVPASLPAASPAAPGTVVRPGIAA